MDIKIVTTFKNAKNYLLAAEKDTADIQRVWQAHMIDPYWAEISKWAPFDQSFKQQCVGVSCCPIPRGGAHYLHGNLEAALTQYERENVFTRPLFTERCTVVFIHHYAKIGAVIRNMRDYDNVERRCITNVIARHFLRDDSPTCFISMDMLAPGDSDYEENFTALLRSAFTGHFPADNSGALVFGQDWKAAESVFDIYLRGKKILPPKKSGVPGELLGTTNLGNPLFYLPIQSEALELMALMRFPDWRRSLIYYISSAHIGQGQNNWSYQYDGRHVFIVADLNLTNLAIVLRGMMRNPREPVTIICLPWQREFILSLVKEYGGEKVNCFRLSQTPNRRRACPVFRDT